MSDRPATLCAAFQHTATLDPDATALRNPGGTASMTWRQYSTRVREVAAGMAALGIGRGDTVALMMANRIEFYPVEVGAQHVGATSFSVYNTLAPAQLGYVFSNAGNRMVICEAQYVERLRACGVPIEFLVVIDDDVEGTLTLDALIAGGKADYDFESGWRAVQPGDVATLIYTSGTTGNPKGVESTHTNLLAEAYAFSWVFDIEFGDRITSFMPSAHIADRFTALYLQEIFGVQITAVSDAKQIAAALTDVRPTIWGAVPRVWEKLKAAIESSVAAEPDPEVKRALGWALLVAGQRAAVELAGGTMTPQLQREWAAADAAVLSKLRAKLGLDQLRWALSGAAPIPPETLGFFAGLGIPIAEIWGMSELSCVASATHPRETKLGTVGRMLPGMEYRIAADGELLVRGPLVMKGYRNDPVKTAEAVDPEGWLHTGDIATVDADGFLRMVDRKKELIINSAGKNMSPANIENTIKAATPLIGAMAVIGDARLYNTALIVLDAENASAIAAQHGIADSSAAALADDSGVIAAISAGVALGNQRLARVEQIKRFIVLPTFWEPGGDEVTLTMKLRRRVVEIKYVTEIAELYLDTPRPHVHTPTADTETIPSGVTQR
ncbi:fatty acid--CoA ligase FadD11 [Nocardia sp. NPDC051756]|uniref:fatty acid--CoA ligase FadD11 n=1 Tax=Nocardia sp. NPDC051756 TaxID=3154751 RepID=UPI003422B8CD